MKILNTAEINEAQVIIDKTPEGIYELKELYSQKWDNIHKPTSFGAAFKASVLAGQLKHIQLIEPPKTNNHYTYRITHDSSVPI